MHPWFLMQLCPNPQYPHNQEGVLEKSSPSSRCPDPPLWCPALPPAGRVSHGVCSAADTDTGAQEWGVGHGEGGDSPGELGRGRKAVWSEERQGGGASAEVLAPREARWRPPGKKGLVLAEERGGEQRIHSKAQARLRAPQGDSPKSSSEWAREGTKC